MSKTQPGSADPFATPTEGLSRPSSVVSRRSIGRRRIFGRSVFAAQVEGLANVKSDFIRREWLRAQPPSLDRSQRRPLGVVSRGQDPGSDDVYYLAEPDDMHPDLTEACDLLAYHCAFTMSSGATAQLFAAWPALDMSFGNAPACPYPVLSQLSELSEPQSQLPKAMAYICPGQQIVYVFAPSATELIWNGVAVELALLRFLYEQQSAGGAGAWPVPSPMAWPTSTPASRPSYSNRTSHKSVSYASEDGIFRAEKGKDHITTIIEMEDAAKAAAGAFDVNDTEAMKIPERKQPFWFPIRMAIVAMLVMLVTVMGAGKIYKEWAIGGEAAYPRMAFAAGIPVFAFFSIFFFCVIVGCLFFVFGPVEMINSGCNKYFSSRKPQLERHRDVVLPHITIQMPVYKEGLQSVIKPTVDSIMAAIRHYESKGGTANYFVCDDGIQAIAPDLALARQRYYEYMGIGWCARPKHEYSRKNKDGFNRRGKFKKASNLNYSLDFALRVETRLEEILTETSRHEGCQLEDISKDVQDSAYDRAISDELAKDEGRTLAAGNIRIGEIILLIDSDTRVPEDCLIYGALEMEESPDVAIVQHECGVMQVINNTFENAITYFTNLIYLCIRAGVGLGDLAPFVGHNAFLRWRAVQDVAFYDKSDNNTRKFWTDNNVSEDFDVALRLETVGYSVRYATYHQGGFKEGVSLTVFDELLRWEKYAYGTSEMIFNPLYQWIYKGPFSKLILQYTFSTRIPGSSKLSLFAYLGTYFAIGFTLPLTLANYFLVGWVNGYLPASYLPSWNVTLAVLVIFNLVNVFCFAWYRQRVRDTTFPKALWEHIKWMPIFILFFNGLSFHILKALICHLFSLPIEWSATEKEIGPQGLMVNLDRIMQQFKWVFLVSFAVMGGMIYCGLYAPRGWLIQDFTVIIPLALQVAGHVLLPIIFAVIN